MLLAGQHRAATGEQIHQWRIYKCGMKLLGKMLKSVESLLSSAHPSLTLLPFTSPQLADQCQVWLFESETLFQVGIQHVSLNLLQCLNEALERHSSMLTETLEAGRLLCETTSDSDARSRLELEIRAIEGAWKHADSLVQKRRTLVSTTVQVIARVIQPVRGVIY